MLSCCLSQKSRITRQPQTLVLNVPAAAMPELRVQLVRVAVSLLALSWLWPGVADAQVPSSIAGFPVANFTLASKGPVPKHGANSKYDAMGYFGAGPQVKSDTQHSCCRKQPLHLVFGGGVPALLGPVRAAARTAAAAMVHGLTVPGHHPLVASDSCASSPLGASFLLRPTHHHAAAPGMQLGAAHQPHAVGTRQFQPRIGASNGCLLAKSRPRIDMAANSGL